MSIAKHASIIGAVLLCSSAAYAAGPDGGRGYINHQSSDFSDAFPGSSGYGSPNSVGADGEGPALPLDRNGNAIRQERAYPGIPGQ